ncbi:type II toxin-antitoxin system RatA family toxin [Halotalea alkalilenta]|uniref:Ubiquinone-binding protein n=1 Tax=Halotalea alkalilenta TaxID=376489 RepID=A0A172YJI5_9GAMM|nr:type II toxin-antitoxin system RatA family toxin [Halotalea alkalilenta]ANF59401.1 ubiquinone-binding protein [Halotalea alkalilenta]
MPTVKRTALVRHSSRQMFDLVNDFESYPQFLPGCRAARLIERTDDYLIGEMTLAKGGIKQSIVTRNDLHTPERIDLSLVKGPFKSLDGYWRFEPLSDESCRVTLEMRFDFSNRLLGMAFGQLFGQMAGQLVDAFTRRADQVHGG